MNPYERMQEKSRLNQERAESRHHLAFRQGFVMISVSPRRSIIVQVSGNRTHKYGNVYKTVMTADTVFGPATWQACEQWIAENVPALPEELNPR